MRNTHNLFDILNWTAGRPVQRLDSSITKPSIYKKHDMRFSGQHGGLVVSTVASQQEDFWFEPQQGSLLG